MIEDKDPLGSTEEVISQDIPTGVDRRTFLMRSAVIGATAVITGRYVSAQERTAGSTAAAPKLDPALNVVQKGKGPVMTTVGDRFLSVFPLVVSMSYFRGPAAHG